MAFRDATVLNTRASGLEVNRPSPHPGGPLQVMSEEVAADANDTDIFRFLRLPVGATIFDAWLSLSAAAGTAVIADFGILSVSGDTDVTADDAFGATLDIDAAIKFRSTQAGIIVLNDDVWVTATISVADFDAAKTLRATVFFTLPGVHV